MAASNVSASVTLTDQGIEDAHPGKEPEHRVFRGVTKQVPPGMRRRLHDVVGAILLPRPRPRSGSGHASRGSVAAGGRAGRGVGP